jgi:hypothetical protein
LGFILGMPPIRGHALDHRRNGALLKSLASPLAVFELPID